MGQHKDGGNKAVANQQLEHMAISKGAPWLGAAASGVQQHGGERHAAKLEAIAVAAGVGATAGHGVEVGLDDVEMLGSEQQPVGDGRRLDGLRGRTAGAPHCRAEGAAGPLDVARVISSSGLDHALVTVDQVDREASLAALLTAALHLVEGEQLAQELLQAGVAAIEDGAAQHGHVLWGKAGA